MDALIKARAAKIMGALEHEGEELRREYQDYLLGLLGGAKKAVEAATNVHRIHATIQPVEQELARFSARFMEWTIRQAHCAHTIDSLINGTGLREVESSAKYIEGFNAGQWPVVK